MTDALLPPPPPSFRGDFLTDEPERARYADASGILCALPRAAAVPRDVQDVQTLARWAADTRTPLIPRGAGTGMPGGNVGHGVVVDLVSSFRSAGPVDEGRRTARVQPGATLAELNAACAPFSLHFPVDPSSGARCSLGGMLANNSGGAHSVKYGSTRGWVDSLDVVLAGGERATVRRGVPPESAALRSILQRVDEALLPQREWIAQAWPELRKNSSGYALQQYLRDGDVVDLLVGSEGTLALIVGAEVRLAPIPARRGLALLEFTSLVAAGEAVQALLPLGPATCEMLDRTFLELVRRGGGDEAYPLREGLEAILIVEMEGDSEAAVEASLAAVEEAVRARADRVVLASDPAEQARLWEIRHAASPIIAREAGDRVSMQFIEDGVVPVARLADYVRALRRILQAHHLPAVIFGHAGDGNLHVNPLVDVHAPHWQDTLQQVLHEVAGAIAGLGGTLSGEHGDGRLRAPMLETIWGERMVALFRAVKDAFDPLGILNPGVKLPLPGQHPFDMLRSYR